MSASPQVSESDQESVYFLASTYGSMGANYTVDLFACGFPKDCRSYSRHSLHSSPSAKISALERLGLDYKPGDRAKHVDAFFGNIDWDIVDDRLQSDMPERYEFEV